MRNIALIAFVLATITVACAQEPDLSLDLKDKTLPSFSFSGRSLAIVFEVLEVPRTGPLSEIDPYKFKGEAIWKLTIAHPLKGADWPSVTYGAVPHGFSQNVPEQGPPPKLVEGKLYVAQILGEKDAKTGFFFEVRNNRIVNVTHKVFGP